MTASRSWCFGTRRANELIDYVSGSSSGAPLRDTILTNHVREVAFNLQKGYLISYFVTSKVMLVQVYTLVNIFYTHVNYFVVNNHYHLHIVTTSGKYFTIADICTKYYGITVGSTKFTLK
jgi:hypothetical protein